MGQALRNVGVKLRAVYGGTEFGAVGISSTKVGDEEDWEYLEVNGEDNPVFVAQGDGTYELQFIVSPFTIALFAHRVLTRSRTSIYFLNRAWTSTHDPFATFQGCEVTPHQISSPPIQRKATSGSCETLVLRNMSVG